jgi:hypothetical protein
MAVIFQPINYFFCIKDLHGAVSQGNVKLLVVEGAGTGLIQSLIKNSIFVTEFMWLTWLQPRRLVAGNWETSDSQK